MVVAVMENRMGVIGEIKGNMHKLVVRCHDKALGWFNGANKVKLESVFGVLSQGCWPCCVSRRDGNEILVSVPVEKLGGQVDLVLVYDKVTNSYNLCVYRNSKSRFREVVSLPEPDCCVCVRAQFVFLKPKEPFVDLQAIEQMLRLNEMVAGLAVSSGMPVGVQQDVWAKFIEAQAQIVDSLSEPFVLAGEPLLSGNRLELRLPVEDSYEYKPLVEALSEDLKIEAVFDSKGNALMRLDDIFRGVDSVISKRFADKFFRVPSIGCVVQVRSKGRNGAFSDKEWDDIFRDIYALDYKFNARVTESGGYISFDFESKEGLEKAVAGLESIGKLKFLKSPRSEGFKFKVRIDVVAKKSEREIFEERLKKLNGADFVYDYISEEKGRARQRSVFVGRLDAYSSSVEKLVLYLPNVSKEDKRLSDIFLKFWSKNGRKIDTVRANLVGDKAKLEWLKEAISKISEDNDSECPNSEPVNNKIKEFVFDSSKAAPVLRYEGVDIGETPEFENFDSTSVLKLNDSQKKAVLKGVAATDLCVLQGPPGTGKTTVIAELIWQHIRRKQDVKLLLTSETNVAVDNALAKLMNEKAVNPDMARYLSLIKPLRFGKADKFEEEGKRYSIERIEKWVGDGSGFEDDYEEEILEDDEDGGDGYDAVEDVADNVVQHWMHRIASRSKFNDVRYAQVLKDWTAGLAMPDKETKALFRNLFYKHVNVVGSTCASTGSPGFLLEYLRTFNSLNPRDFRSVKSVLSSWKGRPLSDNAIYALANALGCDEELSIFEMEREVKEACTVKFDAVIMDEASKATPPELLMPLCFGKKSIVIGDHRQLAPMLNEKSFKEALLDLNTPQAKRLAEEIDRDYVDTSQFKRMILNKRISPTIKATFNLQYRMHPQINDVIKQFYVNDESGGLKCGLNPEFVDSPDLNNPESRYHGLRQKGFITPNIHTIWVNVETPECADGSSTVNVGEIEAINTVLAKLSGAEGFKEYMSHWDSLKEEYKRVEEKEIAVISFYGKQVGRIKRDVMPHASKLGLKLKINTVDKFQGMERNIVIVSTVRSDVAVSGAGYKENTKVGFADSPERLNVALSRARRLLIVVGNKKFFSNIRDKEGNYLYLNAIKEIERSGKVVEYTDLING